MSGTGFLSETQREYLHEEHDPPSDNAEYQIRRRIRENTRQALADLELVADRVSPEDMQQIAWQPKEYSSEDDEGEARTPFKYQPAGFTLGIVPSVVSLLYRLHADADVFEKYTQMGIEQALKKERFHARVGVSIEIHKQDSVDEIAERLENDGVQAVSNAELRALLDAGELSHVEHAELVLEKEEERHTSRRMRRASDSEERNED